MTNADSEARIIDVPLLLWSLLAAAELFIIAHLTLIPWVAFFCFVLIGPFRAGLGDESEFEEIEEPPKEYSW